MEGIGQDSSADEHARQPPPGDADPSLLEDDGPDSSGVSRWLTPFKDDELEKRFHEQHDVPKRVIGLIVTGTLGINDTAMSLLSIMGERDATGFPDSVWLVNGLLHLLVAATVHTYFWHTCGFKKWVPTAVGLWVVTRLTVNCVLCALHPVTREHDIGNLVAAMVTPMCLTIVLIDFRLICLSTAAVFSATIFFETRANTTHVSMWFCIAYLIAAAVMIMLITYVLTRKTRLGFLQLEEIKRQKLTAETAELRLATTRASWFESIAEAKEQQRIAETRALSAVNHCAKHVMDSTVYWMDISQRKIGDADSELAKIVGQVMKDNELGFRRCKRVLMWKQLSANEYVPRYKPCDIRRILGDRYAGQSITVVVGDAVPLWVLLDEDLFDVVLANAIHNAVEHGKDSGRVEIRIHVNENDELLLLVENEPGPKHAIALALQTTQGPNFLLADTQHAARNSLGTSQSTFMGMGEIKIAASMMDADVGLFFETHRVSFSMKLKLQATTVAATAAVVPPLRDEVRVICADDDAAPRAGYKGLMRKLNVAPDRYQILGESWQEASRLTETVLSEASAHGDANTLCIFDQNMDRYTEGRIYGTDICKELRGSGFSGLIFIRSANDSVEDLQAYRAVGATGSLPKGGQSVAELANDLLTKAHLATATQM